MQKSEGAGLFTRTKVAPSTSRSRGSPSYSKLSTIVQKKLDLSLLAAVNDHDYRLVERLLKTGANVNTRDILQRLKVEFTQYN